MKADYPAEIIQDPFLINSWSTSEITYRFEYLETNQNISIVNQRQAFLA